MVAIDARGMIGIVEIKVARADLLADSKWPDYLEWCDFFYWALPPALDPDLLAERQPQRCGLIVGDRYDAVIVREAAQHPLVSARRRSELLRIGRLAMRRLSLSTDPELALMASFGEMAL